MAFNLFKPALFDKRSIKSFKKDYSGFNLSSFVKFHQFLFSMWLKFA